MYKAYIDAYVHLEHFREGGTSAPAIELLLWTDSWKPAEIPATFQINGTRSCIYLFILNPVQ